MITHLRFEGGIELQRVLSQLPSRVSSQVRREALREAAEPIRQRMSVLAPHEPGKPDLRDMMVIGTARGVRGRGQSAVAVGPSPSGFYGFFQEFGTRRHGAQPFARPAFDAVKNQSLGLLRSDLWNAIKRRRGGRSSSSGLL